MAQRFPTPRGIPFTGFPYGLLRRWPLPIWRVDPGLIKPDGATKFTASSLTPGGQYQVIINYISAASVIAAQIDTQADIAGSISIDLKAEDVLGKAMWDTGTYFLIVMQKPSTVVGITAFLVAVP